VSGVQCLCWQLARSLAQCVEEVSIILAQRLGPHTLVRAEAPLPVIIKAGRGCTPLLAITAAGSCAAVVLFAQEGEGEDTGGTFRIPTHSGHSCGGRDVGQGAAKGSRQPGNNNMMLTLTTHIHSVLALSHALNQMLSTHLTTTLSNLHVQ
jgi:hypothetical protein